MTTLTEMLIMANELCKALNASPTTDRYPYHNAARVRRELWMQAGGTLTGLDSWARAGYESGEVSLFLAE